MRESPAIPIVKMLVERGVRVTAYDPIACQSAQAVLPSAVRYADTLDEAVADVDAALLVTRWDEFHQLPALFSKRDSVPLLIDGRRMLARDAVAKYDGIGL